MRYIVSIGSNEGREANMALARGELQRRFADVCFSSEKETLPLNLRRTRHFSNQLAWFTSPLLPDGVREQLKQIERLSGRCPEEKEQEIIRLDLDLLWADDQVLRPADLDRPYIRELLREAADCIPLSSATALEMN